MLNEGTISRRRIYLLVEILEISDCEILYLDNIFRSSMQICNKGSYSQSTYVPDHNFFYIF